MQSMTMARLGLGLGVTWLLACSGDNFDSLAGAMPSAGRSSVSVANAGGGGAANEAGSGDPSSSGRGDDPAVSPLGPADRCEAGERRCDGLRPQVCNGSGEFEDDGESCAFACRGAGNCTGECVPTATDCGGPNGERRICTAAAEWSQPEACQFVCVDGACGGSCVPGTARCTANDEVETCSEVGTWETSSVCSGETPRCLQGDAAAPPRCVCATGARFCDGTSDLEVCQEDGSLAPQGCGLGCDPETLACTHAVQVCLADNSGTVTATCGDSSVTVTTFSGFACARPTELGCVEGAELEVTCKASGSFPQFKFIEFNGTKVLVGAPDDTMGSYQTTISENSKVICDTID